MVNQQKGVQQETAYTNREFRRFACILDRLMALLYLVTALPEL